jgi:hypothetical protein
MAVQFGRPPGMGSSSQKKDEYKPKVKTPLKRGDKGWDVFMKGGTADERTKATESMQTSMQARTADYNKLVSDTAGDTFRGAPGKVQASRVSAADLRAATEARKEREAAYLQPVPVYQDPSDSTTWGTGVTPTTFKSSADIYSQFDGAPSGVPAVAPKELSSQQRLQELLGPKSGAIDYSNIPADLELSLGEQDRDLTNPWRTGSRLGQGGTENTPGKGSYNPAEDGAPRTMWEAQVAQRYINDNLKFTSRIGFFEGGWVKDSEGDSQRYQPEFFYDKLQGTPFTINEKTGEVIMKNQALADVLTRSLETIDDEDLWKHGIIPIDTPGLADIIANQQIMEDLKVNIAEVHTADNEWRKTRSEAEIAAKFNREQSVINSQLAMKQQYAGSQYEKDVIETQARAQLEELDVRIRAEKEMATLQHDFDTGLVTAQQKLDIALQENRQSFEDGQASLDRALQRQEFNEVERSSRMMEYMRQQELDLQQQQFQLTLFMALAQNPAMLHFLQNSGALALFGDVMGDDGQALQQLMEGMNVQESQGMGNIQEISRLSAEEQAQQMYALSAQTGSQDPVSILRGSAPMAVTNPVGANTPLLGGAPPTNMTVSNRGSTASTPLSIRNSAPNLPPSRGVQLRGGTGGETTTPAYERWLTGIEGEGDEAIAEQEMGRIVGQYREGEYDEVGGSEALNSIALQSPFSHALWVALVNNTMAITNEDYTTAARRLMIGPLGQWRQSGLQGR